MTISIIDSTVYASAWSSEQVKAWLSEDVCFKRFVEILLAYTEAQTIAGVIPGKVLKHARQAFKNFAPDLVELGKNFSSTQHSLHGLIETLRERLPDGSKPYFAVGITVQDVTDSAYSMVLRDYLDHLRGMLASLVDQFRRLTDDHASTIMLGRTHGQTGVVMTFGHKAAVWLSETRRLQSCLENLSPMEGQLSGAVGASTFYDAPTDSIVTKEFCRILHLACPSIGWTNSRLTWYSALQSGFHLSVIAAKCARELFLLSRSEIGEVQIRGSASQISSITMLHKKNPEGLEQVETLHAIVKSQFQMFNDGLLHEHERDGAKWKAEWFLLPNFINASVKQMEIILDSLARLTVNVEQMRSNILTTRGSAFSERLYIALSTKLGFTEAKRIVTECSGMLSHSNNESLLEMLKEHPSVKASLSTEDIDQISALLTLPGKSK